MPTQKPEPGGPAAAQNNTPPKAQPAQPSAPAAPTPIKKDALVKLTADFGDVYIKVTPKGDVLRPIKAEMRLFDKLGHFYAIFDSKGARDAEQAEESGGSAAEGSKFKYSITAAGYTHLNKGAGISILTPQSVIVDGVARHNPYVERADRTKAITSVIIHKVGIGYAPNGSIVVIDKVLFYNTYTYFIQSIQAKMKEKLYYPKDGAKKGDPKNPNAAMYGTENENPAKMTPPRPGRWAFFSTEPPLGIWANYDDPAILDCLSEHTQRQRFGDRIAQRIAERNIYKDHPAIGVSQVFAKKHPGGAGMMADVVVYGYRHDLMPAQIAEIMRQTEEGGDSAPFEIQRSIESDPDLEDERTTLAEVIEAEAEVEPKVVHAEAQTIQPPPPATGTAAAGGDSEDPQLFTPKVRR